jgi:cysteinyl-tRNA synthetase
MITINGRKMGKSYNNTITLREMFFGGHHLLEKGYSPMTVRFFILQTQYRSTLDFSNEALQAAEKALQRMMNAFETIEKLKPGSVSTSNIGKLRTDCYAAMNDDFNTAIVIANLFEAVRIINSVNAGTETLTENDIAEVKSLFELFLFEIMGIKTEKKDTSDDVDGLMQLIIDLRAKAKSDKDFATADKIRDSLTKLGISVKDGKEGTSWMK